MLYIMSWEVENTDEFVRWFVDLSRADQDAIDFTVDLLITQAPNLRFPHSSGVNNSRHAHMRELRIQSEGKPLRIFYAFDPRRSAILLIGGDKTGDNRFYARMTPIADKLYEDYLKELKQEGLLK
jgi:hypothetical protein